MPVAIRSMVVAGLAVGVLAGSLAAAAGGTPTPAPRPGGAIPVSDPITIDSGDVFLHPRSLADPPITAVRAWRRYTRSIGHPQRRPDAGIRTFVGRLASSATGQIRPAYGFKLRQAQGCLTTNPKPTPHSPQCHEWTFVSARTGRSLGVRQQVVRPHR